jgi:hypothetical protein
MRIFRLGKISVVCNSESTRSGFRHVAHLLYGAMEDKAKACYLNRTWEAFTYQTVLRILIEKTTVLNKDQKRRFKKKFSL